MLDSTVVRAHAQAAGSRKKTAISSISPGLSNPAQPIQNLPPQ